MAYSTDTRTLQPGDTFVAVRGERYDGHDFVSAAIKKGASAAIVEHPVAGVPGSRLLCVPDTTIHLAAVARERIRRKGCQLIAITGSVGKTTTKNAIATVLGMCYPVVSSKGNLNTLLGLSLTLVNSDIQPGTKLVLEMGASRKGDLASICEYFRPDIAVVTNVRGVHLETFGSIGDVQKAKGELVRALDSSGVACLNADDPLARGMEAWCLGRTVFYGMSQEYAITPEDITVELPLLGRHVIYVAMAAFAVAHCTGMAPKMINQALRHIKPEKGRLCKLNGRGGAVLIDDSYNASPDAMQSALEVMQHMAGERRIVFLGDMLELGPSEVEEHVVIIQKALECADQVVVVGSINSAARSSLLAGLRDRVQAFADSEELARMLTDGQIYEPRQGDIILVKGSQGSRMERVSRALLAPDINPASVLPRQSQAWLAI